MTKTFKNCLHITSFIACTLFTAHSNAQLFPVVDAGAAVLLTGILASIEATASAAMAAAEKNAVVAKMTGLQQITLASQALTAATGLSTLTQNALIWNDRANGRITRRDTNNDPVDKPSAVPISAMSAPMESTMSAPMEYENSGKIEKYINQSGIGKNDKGLIKKDNLEFLTLAQQVSLSRAAAEKSYGITIDRVPKINLLYKSIFDVVGAKEAAEVSSMIQAQLLVTQNEANTIATMSQLSRTQQDMQRVTARGTSVQRKVQGLVGGW